LVPQNFGGVEILIKVSEYITEETKEEEPTEEERGEPPRKFILKGLEELFQTSKSSFKEFENTERF
jgi:hypothetical protein